MVRARIRMFGPRLVVMLGRTHETRAAAAPRPLPACPSHGSGWDVIESAARQLSRASVQQLLTPMAPERTPLG